MPPPPSNSGLLASARRILEVESAAVSALATRIGTEFEHAAGLVRSCSGRIVVTGMGKSGLVARKIAATLNSTGTPALFLHPAEALHGDLGMLVSGDVVIALSYSGETAEILNLLGPIQRLGIPLLAMTGDAASPLARAAEVHLDVGVAAEACPLGLAPSASTTAALAMGDALALAVAELRGFSERDFAGLHPGGKLGKRLTTISDLMHTGDALPLVHPASRFPEVLHEMSHKGFGVAAVVDADRRLLGLISDGDLRRLLLARGAAALDLAAADYMTREPVTISPEQLAPAALRLMEQRKITAVPVTLPTGVLAGLVHLHDLWTTELI